MKGIQTGLSEVQESEPDPLGFFADTKDNNSCSVKVAVRARPLIGKESNEGICVECYDDQIVMGKERTFTFDAVFGMQSSQEEIFQKCVKN